MVKTAVAALVSLLVAVDADQFLASQPPEKGADMAYNTKDDACSACKYYFTKTESLRAVCVCGATNAFTGEMATTDTDNWYWACSFPDTWGKIYQECFPSTGALHVDHMGDSTDPHGFEAAEEAAKAPAPEEPEMIV